MRCIRILISVIHLKPELIFSLFITTLLIIFSIVVGNKFKNANPLEKPKGIMVFVQWLVTTIDNYVSSLSGFKSDLLNPYILSIAMFIFVANISGLFGIIAPTSSYSITLALAIATIGTVHGVAIKKNGFLGYWKRYSDPHPLFIIINIPGTIAPLVSLSLRLFCNIFGGGMILSLVYAFTTFVSNAITGLFVSGGLGLDVVAWVIAPILHFYFDLFSGFIQTLVFITLTTIFISSEV